MTARTQEKKAPSKTNGAHQSAVAAESVAPEKDRRDPIDEAIAVGPFMKIDDDTTAFTTPYGEQFARTDAGVFFVKDGHRIAVCGPLWIDGEAQDEDGGDRRLIVKWIDREGREHSALVERGDLVAAPQKVVRMLASFGLEIRHALSSQGGSSKIQNYLTHYPLTSRDVVKGVKRLGWIKPGETFLMPNDVIIGKASARFVFTGDPVGAPKYSEKGTLSDWQNSIGIAALSSCRMTLAICAGLAPVLMDLLPGSENGGFHFYGNSSKGKSTMARATCSVWGCASDDEDSEMASWRQTDNSIESMAAAHHSFPMVIDEITQVDPDKLVEILYMMCNGKGKGRMTKGLTRSPTLSWRCLFVSTGERTTDEHARTGRKRQGLQDGALIRVVNIPATVSDKLGIFDSTPEGMTPRDLADRVNHAAKVSSYGTPGPAFVERLIKEIEACGGAAVFSDRLTERVEEWVQDNAADGDSKAVRVARRFALCAVAGELATRFSLVPWQDGYASGAVGLCFQAWRSQFKSDEEKDEEAIAEVEDFVRSQIDRFDRVSQNGLRRRVAERGKKNGAIKDDDDGACIVYFIPSVFRTDACGERAPREVLSALRRKKRLLENDGRGGLKAKKDCTVAKGVDLNRAIAVSGIVLGPGL